ncbi:LPS export ABC transporter periplasmic protein LptC [Lusitaniella coriacea LEGE 07157]|uniref:LPS export ABC transporter periplasmic protein LptC n=1 Tax=Lusitaniella coriacea LEGE 07157 TaxID=945747 RepID=A0A8J7AWS5_9CYAN|nr:LptA/OstA family protein [Lusitaniella coriacea]MBE9114912.1 LPS export ABC transporter periplasmic protein LptC [Lusitaniella coriacea LEGE 07157]
MMIPSVRRTHRWGWLFAIPVAIALTPQLPNAQAQTSGGGRPITVVSDRQEADQLTGVVTAIGNVQISYPARQIRATSAQAQYFQNENKIILTGNVFVSQAGGNNIRAERVEYLISEQRFLATPQVERQVESTYIISDPEAPTEPPIAPVVPPFNPKPAFKTPVSE